MLYKYDEKIREEYGVFCGVDEAGRGPAAGNVFAAAVMLPKGYALDGVNDSKKLRESERERLFGIITGENEIAWAIAQATVAEIKELNILGATMLAMERAIAGLIHAASPNYHPKLTVVSSPRKEPPQLALVDGNRKPELEIAVKTLVRGDGISASIAAASILAKVARDAYMKKQSEIYPEYNFEKHKGYVTKLHVECLRKYGACPIHRMKFVETILGKATAECSEQQSVLPTA
jgi:ribonuclease HII